MGAGGKRGKRLGAKLAERQEQWPELGVRCGFCGKRMAWELRVEQGDARAAVCGLGYGEVAGVDGATADVAGAAMVKGGMASGPGGWGAGICECAGVLSFVSAVVGAVAG
ncbi:MAG: hypothetical protein KatS3mg132_461 [Limisphaera sp.]|nr:MAG: hypothetical protein KatS3mg132_461 [Limisphaera sp.]